MSCFIYIYILFTSFSNYYTKIVVFCIDEIHYTTLVYFFIVLWHLCVSFFFFFYSPWANFLTSFVSFISLIVLPQDEEWSLFMLTMAQSSSSRWQQQCVMSPKQPWQLSPPTHPASASLGPPRWREPNWTRTALRWGAAVPALPHMLQFSRTPCPPHVGLWLCLRAL